MADQAVAYALTTVTRVKARVGITDTGFDTALISYVNAATAFIEQRIGRRLLKATYSNEVYHIGKSERRYLVLKQAPVTTLTSIDFKAGTPTTPSWTALLADDYELLEDGKSGLVAFHINIPTGINSLRVNYAAGYLIDFANYGNETLHTLPYDITELAERLIIKRFKKRDEEGKSQVAFGGGTTTWDAFLDESDKAILASYSRSIAQFI